MRLSDFGSNAGELFKDIVELGFDTKIKVKSAFLAEGYLERSSSLLDQLRRYVQEHPDETIQIEPDSSDVLLVLLLNERLEDVLEWIS